MADEAFSIEVLDPDSGLFVSLTNGGSGAIMLGEHVLAAAPIPETDSTGFLTARWNWKPSEARSRWRSNLRGSRSVSRAS